jgi:uncharacterized membrane protein
MSAAPPTVPAQGMKTARIETLVDGVFAIAMTLLIFDIRVPLPENVALSGLPVELAKLAPNLVGYALSFVLLGVFWVGHHNQYVFIRRANRTLLWLNILYLMTIAFIPFSAGLLSRYHDDQIAVVIYGLNLIACGLALYLHWWYAVKDRHLVDADLLDAIIRLATRRILVNPVLYFAAVLLSFVNPALSIVLYAAIPWWTILPGRVDRTFSHRHTPKAPSDEADRHGAEARLEEETQG